MGKPLENLEGDRRKNEDGSERIAKRVELAQDCAHRRALVKLLAVMINILAYSLQFLRIVCRETAMSQPVFQ